MIGISKEDFREIFDKYYEPVRNFIYYKAGNMQLAEDLAQDAFFRIWEKREEIRKETVKALIYKIANNLFLNWIEHQNVILKFSVKDSPVALHESPEFELEMKEFDKKLQDAINSLDEKKRVVFLMNRIDKYTYREIAESQGITVKAVEKRMEKAIDHLKKHIQFKI
jgi:RNA polymerase sigma-70 factor (family 1)